MRTIAALLVLCLSGVAAAQSADPSMPPSKTLERAIKLYDKQDFFSASIELGKVLQGDSGDDARNKQRAEYFMVKTLYQLGFHAPAWSRLVAIAQAGPGHLYYTAVLKWAGAILRAAPNPTTRSVMFSYRNSNAIDDPINASVRDELVYQLGRELAARDGQTAEAIAALAKVDPRSPLAPRAQLEIARVKLRDNDLAGGIAVATRAAATPEHAAEAARLIASWTHIHGAADRARAPLGELARTSAYARYQLSRALLDGKRELPGLERVTAEVLDAVMLPSACRGLWPDDVKPLARAVIDEATPVVAKLLAVEDNAELADWVMKYRRSPAMPGSDVVLAMLADPAMQERFAWFEELQRELEAVQRADKAWQTTLVAAEVLQELTVIHAIEAADIGVHARQRLQLLARDLDVLARVLAEATSGFALPAGPDVRLGGGLVVTGELCRANGTEPPRIANGGRPASGCGGCAAGDAGGALLVLLALALTRGGRRATRGGRRRTSG